MSRIEAVRRPADMHNFCVWFQEPKDIGNDPGHPHSVTLARLRVPNTYHRMPVVVQGTYPYPARRFLGKTGDFGLNLQPFLGYFAQGGLKG